MLERTGNSIRQGQATPVPIRRMTNASENTQDERKADAKTGQSVGKTIVLIENGGEF